MPETVSSISVRFQFERTTKNTARFNEVHDTYGEPNLVGALYLQKFAWEQLGEPEDVAISITPLS